MQRIILAALAGAAFAAPANAQDAVTLQLKWVAQAQFAGYYVAQDQGFYEEAGLDVTINPGGPDIAPEQVIAGGGADVIVTWMAAALAARERGVPLVNIAQPFGTGGLQLTCLAETGVETPEDFPGRTLGVWFFGNEYPFYAWMAQLGIDTGGTSDTGVTVLRQAFNVDPLLQGQADCISTMTYNEYGQVLDAGYTEDELVNFNYLDEGIGMLEDGLYVMEEDLEDPAFVDKMSRFVAASMEGWRYAEAHPEEAAQIVIDNDTTGAQTLEHQVYMMTEVAKLTEGSDGSLDPAAYEQTVATLLSAVSEDNPAITEEPEGAYTTAVTDMALGE
ncbi:ABC transporter substrate-binding protein [Pseudoroseicyclus aestuarii]|uniref:Thiamine pyrimidine synthase n=1 Tax=Pseudoroseicyclus aestuarii TaxID=1795041 RepID=A0A318SMN8_9RHOB|nr:ABC transporter substrate-binding protein [Pseudoroseicyclus aestuarii]PYE81203.1 NitT/TauT family transport system substrate-binding protein [Pseudoroseicyclus aestuarii]